MAAGGFCLHEFAKEIADRFLIGRHIAIFSTKEHAFERIKYYLDHPEERETIAMTGMNLVRRNYTYKTFLERVFQLVEERLG